MQNGDQDWLLASSNSCPLTWYEADQLYYYRILLTKLRGKEKNT